jgi:hypothetical protein
MRYAKKAWLPKHHGIGLIEADEGGLSQMVNETTQTKQND